MNNLKMSKKQVLEIIEASLEKAIDKVAYARINTYDRGLWGLGKLKYF